MKSVVVVCTRNRPAEVERCLSAVERATLGRREVWVVDASDGEQTAELVQRSAPTGAVTVRHVRAPEVGLARQRNHALTMARDAGVDVVHFVDDDTRVLEGYFEELERLLEVPDGPAGVGGVVLNQPPVARVWLRRVFDLYGYRPGALLRSGRNVFGHVFRPTLDDIDVDWLPGCAMSYHVGRLGELRFDDRLEGYSWGEDLDFSSRVKAAGGALVNCGRALCFHDQSEVNRWDARRLAAEQTVLRHRWVTENRSRGFSVPLFWWSVCGELLIALLGIRRPERAWRTVQGLLEGTRAALTHR